MVLGPAAMNFVEDNQRAVLGLCVNARLVGLRSHRVTTAPLRRMTERLEPAQGQMSQEPAARISRLRLVPSFTTE